MLDILRIASAGKKDLTNVDSCGLAKSLTEGTSHTLLESICSSARKHLVDTDHVPWVHSDSHVEVLLTAPGDHVLVAGNSSSFKGLRSDLLLLVANQVDAGGESIMRSLLLADVVHSDLGVGHTSVESGLGVGLVLLVPVAPGWSSWHLQLINYNLECHPLKYFIIYIKHTIFQTPKPIATIINI